MISTRFEKMTHSASTIRGQYELALKMKAELGNDNVYDFSLGNPSVATPKEVELSLKKHSEERHIHDYMANAGSMDVRETIAENLNKRFGTHYQGKGVIMAVGAGGALNITYAVLLNPGDEVIAPTPCWTEYKNYCANYQAVYRPISCDKVKFYPDYDELEATLNEKTKIVCINSPNNPTGAVYDEQCIKTIASIMKKKEEEYGHPIYLVTDEPYRELVYDGKTAPFVSKYYDDTVVCYSYSKVLSLPGERIGYVAIQPECADYEVLLKALPIVNRTYGYTNAPAIFQQVVKDCIDVTISVEEYDTNRKLLYNAVKELGFDAVYPDGAFYLWVKAPIDEKEFIQLCVKHNVILVGGSPFGQPGYIRIAYCVEKKVIENSLPAFRKIAHEVGLI